MSIYKKSNGQKLHESQGKNIIFAPGKLDYSVVAESESGMLHVNQMPYRGSVEIVPASGYLNIINLIDLEDYLRSVVPGEIPSSWPSEALKAQAIAARSYTIHHITTGRSGLYDLDGTTNFQVYKGAAVERESTDTAVWETAGQVLLSGSKPIIAYFHSTCGGRTADDSHVWKGNDLPYLREVVCDYCNDSPSYQWETELSLTQITSALRRKYRNTGRIRKISFHRESGRISSVSIKHTGGSIDLTGNNFRLLFPPKTIRSLMFSCSQTDNGLILNGNGWGHGVGLCQYGAKGMAERGKNCREILEHYYRDISIASIYKTEQSVAAGNR